MNTKEFLEAFHGNEYVNFRVIKQGKPVNINGRYNQSVIEKLESFNNQGYDIYFVVNGGGTKQSEINKINAVFIDFDAGKDENGNYFSLDIVQEYKKKKLEVMSSFMFKPSFIVETRNGLHVYWLLQEGTTVQDFLECQLRLIQYFDSDKAVKTPERLMRVPGFYWMKYNNSPFMVNIIDDSNDVRYDIKEIIDCLPCLSTKEATQKQYKDIKTSSITDENINIEMIRNRDVEGLRRILNVSESLADASNLGGYKDITLNIHTPLKPPITVRSRKELYHVLCMIDLAEFLGIEEKRFRCIFHNDNSPSANIFIDKDTGHKIYHCFAEACGFTASIIKIVERLQKCNKTEAINFIKAVYSIELVESEWQKKTKHMLQSNIEYLLSGLMSIEYPFLYKRIQYYIPELITLHEFAIINLYDKALSDDGRHVFFATIKQILKVMERINSEKLTNRLGLFAFLFLIDKLPDDKVPEKLLKKSIYIAHMNNHTTPSFFEIPSYDYQTLSLAELKAEEFKARGLSMNGFGREMLLRTYGEEEADRVFPKMKGKRLSKTMQDFADNFDKLVLCSIKFKGYAIEAEILSVMKGNRKENKKKINCILPETLDKYGLVRKRANKELKEKFGITQKGYPFLLLQER